MSAKIKIGTHDGCFHCDEALACFLLKTLPRYKDAEIVSVNNQLDQEYTEKMPAVFSNEEYADIHFVTETPELLYESKNPDLIEESRDLNILSTCDVVVDVGQKYDPSTHRYDHHMRDFKESMSTVIKKPGYNWTVKLSSAGLVYCHFGMEILKLLLPNMSNSDIEQIFKRVYGTFIQEIDGIDNGVPMFDAEAKYRIVTDISSRVDFLNAPWNSEGIDVDQQFSKAMELTGQDFMQHVNRAAYVWWPARSIVEEAIKNRFKVDPSGEIIVLSRGAPWQQHLFTIEKELKLMPTLKYVIFKDEGYRVRAVPVNPSSFVCRVFLPEAWAGLRDKDLEVASGIQGSVFVHTVRFIGGHKTKDGAIMMARKSLQIAKAAGSS